MEASERRDVGYRQLLAWQLSFELAHRCFLLALPATQIASRSLGDQIRRAAVSIPANIAEGHGRRSHGDFLRCLRIAHGSLSELETHLLLVRRLQWLAAGEVEQTLDLVARVGRVIGGLMRHVERLKDAQRKRAAPS